MTAVSQDSRLTISTFLADVSSSVAVHNPPTQQIGRHTIDRCQIPDYLGSDETRKSYHYHLSDAFRRSEFMHSLEWPQFPSKSVQDNGLEN